MYQNHSNLASQPLQTGKLEEAFLEIQETKKGQPRLVCIALRFSTHTEAKKASWEGRVSQSDLEKFNQIYFPPEDYLLVSPPIFVVADGVTLNVAEIIRNNISYPDPSPPKEIAKMFCEAVKEIAEQKLNEEWNEETIKEIFRLANERVAKFNEEKLREFRDKFGEGDFTNHARKRFGATAVFAIIKDNKVYWATVCDSFIYHFDKNMNLKFRSEGRCDGDVIVNGEEGMIKLIEYGIRNLEDGDRILIFDDGFNPFVDNQEFLNFFRSGEWNEEIKVRLIEFSEKMIKINPKEYGKERSLIAILVKF